MLRRRFLGAIPVIIGISFLVFLLMHIAPGDPISLLLGDDATQVEIERARREWGLDKPTLVQYWEFLGRAMQGSEKSGTLLEKLLTGGNYGDGEGGL
jgi:peptide/nickel transport system permease protein